MKKIFLTSVISLLLCTGGSAQGSYKHDIQLGAGLKASDYAAIDGYINILILFLLRETTIPSERSNGLYGTYRYRISHRISAGLTAGTTLLKTGERVLRHPKTPGNYRYNSALIAAEVQFHYIDRPRWSVYGIAGAGLGQTFERKSGTMTDPVEKTRYPLITVHGTPIGVRYGKAVGIFAELGYGYRGIVNAGISLRLK